MNHQELYRLLEFPEAVVEQLNSYEALKTFQMTEDLKNRIISRPTWDDAVKELQTLLGEDPHGFKILWEMTDIICNYSYGQYKERNISDEIFLATMKYITRFMEWDRKHQGEYKFTQAHWFPRELAVIEYRIGALEYEFIDGEEREIGVHIPSDAVFNRESVLESLKDFVKFRDQYYPEWKGVPFVCDTWMLAPAMEELLNDTSNILAFKHLFELDIISEDATWFMGFLFPGHENELETLPENSSLQKKAKEYMLSGKKIGVAKGHIKEEILQIIGAV